MNDFHLLVACDKVYYENWAITFLKSLKHHVPWLELHCHLVNADDVQELPNVNYSYEVMDFVSNDQKLGYLQAVRFLAAANKFKNNEKVIVTDCDALCVRSFNKDELFSLFEYHSVLRHVKVDRRWMAGFIAFKDNFFRQEYAKRLLSKDINAWSDGWDQDVLKDIAEEFQFVEVDRNTWVSVGKHNGKSAFFMSKGSQKFKEKYLERYRYFVERDLKEE